MADEVSTTFVLPGAPGANLAAWRAEPPAFLADGKFHRTDDSYESLVYEANVTTKFMKVTMLGFAKTLYRLSFTFRPYEDTTQVTVIGQASEATCVAMAQYVVAHAGM